MTPSVFGTVPHVGPRHVETVIDTSRACFNSASFWNVPLPDNAALDGTFGSGAVAELDRQSRINATSLNTSSFTAEVLVVPPDQPLVPVKLAPARAVNSPALDKIMWRGLPIPDGFNPTNDSDSQFCAWQPDYVNTYVTPNRHGRYWETQALRRLNAADAAALGVPDGTWYCSWGGRINGTEEGRGHYSWWTGSGYKYQSWALDDPDSTYQEGSWGATATSLPLAPSIVTVEDLQFGRIEHALGLLVYDARGYCWPAQRGDGGAPVGDPKARIKEGMRFRFAPDSVASSGLHPVAKLIFDAVRDYGFVVNDRTLHNLAVRAEPGCQAFYGDLAYWQVLSGFPWADLQLLAVGSDTNYTPTTP